MKPAYKDLAQRLNRVYLEFREWGEKIAVIFLYMPIDYEEKCGSKVFVNNLQRMQSLTKYAKKSYGDYDHLLNQLRNILEDWKTFYTHLTVVFNNVWLDIKHQWDYWRELNQLIRKFEEIISEYEKRRGRWIIIDDF
jgi:hypothetical protein